MLQHLLKTESWGQTLVFVPTQRGVRNLAKKLRVDGFKATELHEGLDQSERILALNGFNSGKKPILVATDIAARGIDIPRLGAVINFALRRSPADYLHRIGRTGRAGESGIAITFVDHQTENHLRLIEKNHLMLNRQQVHGFEPEDSTTTKTKGPTPKKGTRKAKRTSCENNEGDSVIKQVFGNDTNEFYYLNIKNIIKNTLHQCHILLISGKRC